MTAEDLTAQLNGEHASEALSALCALAKTKQGRSDTERLLGDRAILSALAESEQPKVRKNLYRLIGALQNERDLPILCRALETEETMFAVPSILLSLGKLGAKDVLESYRVPVSESEEMDKHVAEIALAYCLKGNATTASGSLVVNTPENKRKQAKASERKYYNLPFFSSILPRCGVIPFMV